MAREKTWQFDMNRAYVPANQSALNLNRYILWYYKAFLTGQIGANFTVLASTITTVTPSTSGGTLADGTYYYRVAALNGATEGPASNEVSAVISGGGGAGSVTLVWAAVAGATEYRVYRGTSAGGENVFYAPGNVTTYTDTNAASTGGSPSTAYGTWCLLGSSDATTAGMDGLDRWTNTFTAGKINRNLAGSAHSWVVLRSPVMATQTYFLLIDWTTSNYQAVFALGIVNPPTGGTTANAPTVQNPATPSGTTFGVNDGSVPLVASAKVHGQLATDGSFNILVSRDFSMKFNSGFLCHLLTEAKATDGFPVWMSIAGDSGVQNPGTGYAAGLGVQAYCLDASVNGTARHPDNSGFGAYGLVTPVVTNIPNITDAFDGTFVMWPVIVSMKAANNNTVRGRLQDVYSLPYTLGKDVPPQGAVDDVATPQYMVVGVWWFPTNVIPQIF